MQEMSALKQTILKMDDRQIAAILKLASQNSRQPPGPAPASPALPDSPDTPWYDRQIAGLDKTCLDRLREDKKRLRSGRNVDANWIRYAETFRHLTFQVPEIFRAAEKPQQMYRRLTAFCQDNDIPGEVVEVLLPSLLEYIRTGHCRPVLICGEQGCGKTTAFQLLIRQALGLPVAVIKVPEEDAGHGLTGTCGSYISADMGAIGRAMLREKSPVVGLLLDEIDKATHSPNHASIDDELLSITDGSVDSVADKYLESVLHGLQYCPLFMTCNDLKQVSSILADRCSVIHFPRADPGRLHSIIQKYAHKELNKDLYQTIDLDPALLDQSIDQLIARDVHSLRKHQQLVELALKRAFHQAMQQPEDQRVAVTREMLHSAEEEIVGITSRRIGFF